MQRPKDRCQGTSKKGKTKVSSEEIDDFGSADIVVYLSTLIPLFFVLTEQCRNESTVFPCEQTNLGEPALSNTKYCFAATGSRLTGSSPGNWIAQEINPQKFTNIDLEKNTGQYQTLLALAIENGESAPPESDIFAVKVYIYCAPCVCQIATAVNIGLKANEPRNLNVRIRVDFRLGTSCSMSSSRLDGLTSSIDYIKIQERQSLMVEVLKLFDRQWMEQSIFDDDDDDHEDKHQNHTTAPSLGSDFSHIVRVHSEDELTGPIVILGEADFCIPFMGAPPFPPFKPGRMPKETQIYQHMQKYTTNYRWCRQFLGTYTQQEPLEKKRPSNAMSDTRVGNDESEPQAKRREISQPDKGKPAESK